MKKSILLYLLALLFICGCSNRNGGQNGGLQKEVEAVFEKSPKDIQPEGTFVIQEEGNKSFYKSLTFKGKKTVVIRDAIFGMDFPSEYDKDEEFLHVKTDKSDLLFEIISEDTIIGEGFAEGLYIKENDQ